MTGLISPSILLFHPKLAFAQPHRFLTSFMVMGLNPVTLVKQVINLIYIQVPLEEMLSKSGDVGVAMKSYGYQKVILATVSGVILTEMITSTDSYGYIIPYSLFPLFETAVTWIWGLTVSEDKYYLYS